jgi:hypothetical protein
VSRRFRAEIICDYCGTIEVDERDNGYRYEFVSPEGWSREKGELAHFDFCSDRHRGEWLIQHHESPVTADDEALG